MEDPLIHSALQAVISRKICSAETILCLSEVNGNLALAGVEESPLWSIDIGTSTTVCLTENDTNCLFVQGEETILSSVNSTTFNVLETLFDFEAPIFQLQVDENTTLCLDDAVEIVTCANIGVKSFDDANIDESEQSFFLLEEGEESPIAIGNEDDSDVEVGGNDDREVAIGILLFQLLLPIGFIAILIATVYKYDLVPATMKDTYRKLFRKADVSKRDLEEIAAQAKEVQERNKAREKDLTAVL